MVSVGVCSFDFAFSLFVRWSLVDCCCLSFCFCFLSFTENYNCAVASVGNQLIFAGGACPETDCSVSAVSSFNVISGQWDHTWPDLQCAREGGHLVCVDKRKLALVGGTITASSTYTATAAIEQLDFVEMDGWVMMQTAAPNCGAAAVASGSSIMFAGGRDNSTGASVGTVSGFRESKWTKHASLKVARSGAGACFWQGKLVCIGGWTDVGFTTAVEHLLFSKIA